MLLPQRAVASAAATASTPSPSSWTFFTVSFLKPTGTELLPFPSWKVREKTPSTVINRQQEHVTAKMQVLVSFNVGNLGALSACAGAYYHSKVHFKNCWHHLLIISDQVKDRIFNRLSLMALERFRQGEINELSSRNPDIVSLALVACFFDPWQMKGQCHSLLHQAHACLAGFIN